MTLACLLLSLLVLYKFNDVSLISFIYPCFCNLTGSKGWNNICNITELIYLNKVSRQEKQETSPTLALRRGTPIQ